MADDLIHKRNDYLGQYKQPVEDEITMQADEKNISQQPQEFHRHPTPGVADCGN
jgi:hypothetical protein